MFAQLCVLFLKSVSATLYLCLLGLAFWIVVFLVHWIITFFTAVKMNKLV